MNECERGLLNDERDTESDLRPEFCSYQDEGCELAESCLQCPFPRCQYERSHGKRRWLKGTRDREIRRLYRSKRISQQELGRIFGVSRRTVGRAVKGISSEGKQPIIPVNLRKGRRLERQDEE